MSIILDGRKVAETVYNEIKQKMSEIADINIIPGITVIQVGSKPASTFYVNKKNRIANELGFKSNIIRYDVDISEEKLLNTIDKLNKDNSVHGILVQLPLPTHISEEKVIMKISPEKDVDGFHPISIGKLMFGSKTFVPCTPAGIMRILNEYNIDVTGKKVVIIGRSNIVGKPLIPLLINKSYDGNATVTVCHSHTKNIEEHTKNADIVIVAIGKPEWLKADMIKKGSILIDVGINHVEDSTKEKGYRLCGDIDFEDVKDKCSMITPVPGGVGQTTVAMLMYNTLQAAQ